MGKFIDLTGQKFGRLTVIERAGSDKHGKAQWLCKCRCGKKCIVGGNELRKGATKSCGCWQKEIASIVSTTHGLSDDKTYSVWKNIKTRCLNPNDAGYKNYGGRGITLFEPWIHDFKAFYEYVSQLEHFGEKGYTLDRINNDGNYEPGNLRYATKTEQQRNTRRNFIVEYEGQKMTLAEASEKSKVDDGTLQSRYYAGDRGDRLFRPVETKHRRKK